MKTLDRYQLERMGFNPPEGPCLSNGRLLRYFILRSKPWLGVEEYLPADPKSENADESEVYAVNYGTHRIELIRSLEELQLFIYKHLVT
ncbi:hypothetical protein [Parapedobacter sp. DT-150]|uniref:hypothetical protein n=1 Tax=Parapedobacter sp. DT-150 TaxID=3396162 RepID=UPI003F1AB86E